MSMLARQGRQKRLEGDIAAGRVSGLTAAKKKAKPKPKMGPTQLKPRIARRTGILNA